MIFSTFPGLVVFGFFLFFNVVASAMEDRGLLLQSNKCTQSNIGGIVYAGSSRKSADKPQLVAIPLPKILAATNEESGGLEERRSLRF
jgi:hypothetical protein